MSDILKAEDVWNTLYNVDVSKFVKEKNNLIYLPWNQAVQLMMQSYPQWHYEFSDDEIHPDGSMTVHCTVVISNLAKRMWLPVMDYRNRAIKNPNAKDISDSNMRCLVKCIGMFGLGFRLYEGKVQPEDTWDDVVVDEIDEPVKDKPAKKSKKKEEEVLDIDDIPGWDDEDEPKAKLENMDEAQSLLTSQSKAFDGWTEKDAEVWADLFLETATHFAENADGLHRLWDTEDNKRTIHFMKENFPKPFNKVKKEFTRRKNEYLDELTNSIKGDSNDN